MFFRLTRMLVLLSIVLGASLSSSFATETGWLPKFDPNNHVMVDPALKTSDHPVNFKGMETELAELARANHLQVFVVATQRSFPSKQVISEEIANDLQARWSGLPGFSNDDYLMIVWVRQENDPIHGSFASYAGNKLQSFGFSASKMRAPNGPMFPALRQFMPRDPKNAILQIVRNVNSGVEQVKSDRVQAERDRIEGEKQIARDRAAFQQRQEAERVAAVKEAAESEARYAQIRTVTIIGAPITLLLGTLAFLAVRYQRRKKEAQALLADWSEKTLNAGHWYGELQDGYLGFLKQQKNWQKRFTPDGKTAKRFAAAIAWYAKLTTRKLAADGVLSAAQSEFDGAHWPSIHAFDEVILILTERQVAVGEKVLSVDDAEFFKGTVEEQLLAPAEILADMKELFENTRAALAEIKAAFDGTEQNRKDIEALVSAIDALKLRLTAAGLDFTPYQTKYQEVCKERDAALALINGDPLEALSDTEIVEAAAGELKSKIEDALQIAETREDIAAKIGQAESQIAEARTTPLTYAYPEAKDGDPTGDGKFFTIVADGSNPDVALSDARKADDELFSALRKGDLSQAAKWRDAAYQAIELAKKIVFNTFEAKKLVEKNLGALRQKLGQMTAAIPGAQASLQSLTVEFPAASFEGEAAKLERAKTNGPRVENEFGRIHDLYFAQDFIGAANLLFQNEEEVGSDSKGLAEISERLAYLRHQRSLAKAKLQELKAQSDALRTRLSKETFFVPAAVDTQFQTAQAPLAQLEKICSEQMSDWPAAVVLAQHVEAEFKSIGESIEASLLAHQSAVQRLNVAKSADAHAESAVNRNGVRERARTALKLVGTHLGLLEHEFSTPKSDWKALATRADQLKSEAEAAESLANEDVRLLRQAQDSLDSVNSRIHGLAVRNFAQTVSWGGRVQVLSLPLSLDLSRAYSAANAVARDISSGDYEAALAHCRDADSAADSAESWANAQLAAAVAELIAEWQEEERQRQERERLERERLEFERQERERQERERQNQNGGFGGNNGGDGGYGGGDGGAGGINY